MTLRIPFVSSAPSVSVIRLEGTISSGGRGLSDQRLAGLIERAFRRGKPKAVALQINSPGGSAAQSSLIAARIRRLSEEKKIPVYAFVEDVAASGGYWLACAADDIYVDPNSIVGSIGVIAAGFGFHEAMGKHGVERRVHTAGGSKSFWDPFSPEKPEDVERLKQMQGEIHRNFIDHVQSRRAGKLADDPALFTGHIWVGKRAIEVGLADRIGHLPAVMREIFGDKVRFRVYGQKRSLFQRLGARVMGEALHELETRADFARFGL
ncbi:S49 family peptidase [Alphaproteobacteria bacterium KMM 3653]|uniref:S49 family peptidase n=1 Tax=Harenicola maris TaxID=2841044 RepID=A0AAP2CPJ5_9RHOB|nr:S49 family peptidase [Harenicola maris]